MIPQTKVPPAIGYATALAFAALTGIFLLDIPVQLSDSFVEFLASQRNSFSQILSGQILGGTYFRPFRVGLIKVLFDLSGGHYYAWFRTFHVVELLLLFVLVARMLNVRQRSDMALVPMALVATLGHHAFNDVLLEAFPVNHFLTIAVCCAAAINLAQSNGGAWVGVSAAALFVLAAGTLESGLLVWVIFVASRIVGYRGISLRVLALVTALLVGYFVFRFGFVGGGLPVVADRATGFGLGAADSSELVRRFGSNPFPLYAYNVVSSIASVLFAEPRNAIWIFARGWIADDIRGWQWLTVATSVSTTLLIGWYVSGRIGRWLRLNFGDDRERLVALFLIVLPANAAFTLVYVKDVILSPSALLYGVSTAAILHHVLTEQRAPGRAWTATAVLSLVCLVSMGWTARYVGIHYRLREAAEVVRNDWAYLPQWEQEQDVQTNTPAERRIRQTLYMDAVGGRPAPPSASSRFLDEWTDPEQ